MPKYKESISNRSMRIKVKLEKNEHLIARDLELSNQSRIAQLLKAETSARFGRTYVTFSGPAAVSLKARLANPIIKYDFFFIIGQIIDLTVLMKKKGLSLNYLLLDFDHVYINPVTREMTFLFLPIENHTQSAGVLAFLEEIVYSIQLDPMQGSEYITRFIYFLKKMNLYDEEIIIRYIQKEEPSVFATINNEEKGKSGFITDKQQDYFAHYNDQYSKDLHSQNIQDSYASSLNRNDSSVQNWEEYSEETTILSSSDQTFEEGTTDLWGYDNNFIHYPSMLRISTDEKINVDKPVFRFGKERAYSDYFVSNNNAVSRSHADLITRDNHYFIIDLNSKNKTFINDRMIPVKQEVELYDGDHVRLGNEEFIFHI